MYLCRQDQRRVRTQSADVALGFRLRPNQGFNCFKLTRGGAHGGDNLAATISPELADLTIYVIDVAGGEKIPRKGGLGITRSDLLVINKTDLAPDVGADLGVMEADTRRMRGVRPFVMANLRGGEGTQEWIGFIAQAGGLSATAA